MKVIIGYDGSRCARAAIWDLSRAGLPDDTHAVVISATEPVIDPVVGFAPFVGVPTDDSAPKDNTTTLAQSAMKEARRLAQEGTSWVRDRCSDWIVDQEYSEDSPAHAILSAAASHNADLIVVGSRGRSRLRRLLVGSVSQEVMRSAHCSVRCVHEHAEHVRGPLRLILAFDPLQMSQAVVRDVAARRWPAGTTLCLLTVTAHQHALVSAGGSAPNSEWDAADTMALGVLDAAGYRAEHIARHGDATRVILEEAKEWGADCIFTTPGAFAAAGRTKISPVVRNVYAAAPCSVEVVRGRAAT
jgi:nucleotide-binding universal stress UspA family protein